MRGAFRAGRFEDGLKQALEEVSALLEQHFQLGAGQMHHNELPNEPVCADAGHLAAMDLDLAGEAGSALVPLQKQKSCEYLAKPTISGGLPLKKLLAVLTLAAWVPSHAALVYLSAVPTNWMLQQYVGGGVVAWYSGSSCTNGQLSLPTGSSADEASRFFAALMSAKVAGKPFFVYYDNATANCSVQSFGLPN